jgi:hypothetical protein
LLLRGNRFFVSWEHR